MNQDGVRKPIRLQQEELISSLPERIGSVRLDYSHYPGKDLYSDGAIEDEILEITKNAARIEYPKIIEKCFQSGISGADRGKKQLADPVSFISLTGQYCGLASHYEGA